MLLVQTKVVRSQEVSGTFASSVMNHFGGRYIGTESRWVCRRHDRVLAKVATIREITGAFGQASGLQLNEDKTIVIALHRAGPTEDMTLPAPLKFQAHAVSGRYLGIHVGSGVTVDRTWEVAGAQLRTRLSLACQKTTTTDQRSLIAAMVIIPKLTYVAQHAWPTMAIINSFSRKITNYVWHATFASEAEGTKAWLNADLAAMDRARGGLAVPDLRAEVMAMAATAVSKWALYGTTGTHIMGDVLFAVEGQLIAPVARITPNNVPSSLVVS